MRGPRTLLALILTCRSFRHTFTPLLYAHWTISLTELDPSDLDTMVFPENRKHTKFLAVLLPDLDFTPEEFFGGESTPVDHVRIEVYLRFLKRILTFLSKIQIFR